MSNESYQLDLTHINLNLRQIQMYVTSHVRLVTSTYVTLDLIHEAWVPSTKV